MLVVFVATTVLGQFSRSTTPLHQFDLTIMHDQPQRSAGLHCRLWFNGLQMLAPTALSSRPGRGDMHAEICVPHLLLIYLPIFPSAAVCDERRSRWALTCGAPRSLAPSAVCRTQDTCNSDGVNPSSRTPGHRPRTSRATKNTCVPSFQFCDVSKQVEYLCIY